jgi:hypothetical protein
MSRPRSAPATHRIDGLPTIFPNAAGIDSGADEIIVAIPPDRDAEPVRVFRTVTPDLEALVAWLLACRIDTVAMESTGVYWVPIYELLEQQGIVPYLVNRRHVKTVPGRKSDWNDAQWLQKLHALGLLQASFRPDAEIAASRGVSTICSSTGKRMKRKARRRTSSNGKNASCASSHGERRSWAIHSQRCSNRHLIPSPDAGKGRVSRYARVSPPRPERSVRKTTAARSLPVRLATDRTVYCAVGSPLMDAENPTRSDRLGSVLC